MKSTGIIESRIQPGYQTEIIAENGIEQVQSDRAGIFLSKVNVGAHVEENEVLAEIIDPMDCSETVLIRANFPGVVFFKNNKPLIDEKTICFKIIKDA